MTNPQPAPWWRPRHGSRPTIIVRLVMAFAFAMAIVLTGASAFVFWRVQNALDRQLDQDLAAYDDVVVAAVEQGGEPTATTQGEYFQIYDRQGRVISQSRPSPRRSLLTPSQLAAARDGEIVTGDVGQILPSDDQAYRVRASQVAGPVGDVVAAVAISRAHRDEALRELLAQLALGDLLALLAACYVGYRTAKGALNPVERYRVAAAEAGENGETRLPVATDRDDELTRLGHTFNDLLDRLRAASARERRFLADASHELRTPLSLMQAEIELTLHRPRSAVQLESAIRSVGDQIERLTSLANALLDLEQLTGVATPRREPVDILELTHEVVERYDTALTSADRTITVDAEPVVVNVDDRWVDLALSNLVDNALRHGAGHVRVSAHQGDSLLTLSVSDEGPGVDAAFAEHAFDRFTRADSSRSTDGAGLGLALVAAVAAAHGGTADIRTSGTGCTVEFSCRV